MYMTAIPSEPTQNDLLWSPTSVGPARWLASPEHDSIIDVARNVFRCPSAMILLEELDGADGPGDAAAWSSPFGLSFAQYTIRNDGPFVVQDALSDARFARNVMVRAYPHIRFFAGVPIVLSQRVPVGALWVADYVVRPAPAATELMALTSLAAVVADYIEKAMVQLSRPAQAAQFDLLASRSLSAVLTIRADGRLASANRAAERLLRMPSDAIVGTAADDIIIGWRLLASDYADATTTDASQTALRTILVEVITADEAIVPALASLSCWLEGGVPTYRLILEELP